MIKVQTEQDMIEAGATHQEAKEALKLWEVIKPAVRIKKNGRVDTPYGDKTPLGLYRLINNEIDFRR